MSVCHCDIQRLEEGKTLLLRFTTRGNPYLMPNEVFTWSPESLLRTFSENKQCEWPSVGAVDAIFFLKAVLV